MEIKKSTHYKNRLLMLYQQENNSRGTDTNPQGRSEWWFSSLWTKHNEVTHYFIRNFVADPKTPRRGIVGFFVYTFKRFFRKGTKFIVDQLCALIFAFQSRSMELAGQMIGAILNLNERENQLQMQMKEQEKLILELSGQLQQVENLYQERKPLDGIEDRRILQIEERLQKTQLGLAQLRGELSHNFMDTEHSAVAVETAEIVRPMQYLGRNNGYCSFSQCGEDGILNYLLFIMLRRDPTEIRYLDIGCNDYRNDSNTYYLYSIGASGVAIDANPLCTEVVQKMRTRDIVINAGVSAEDRESMPFYIMSNYGLSSFSKESVDSALRLCSDNKLEKVIDVPIFGINSILSRFFGEKAPNVLSIDAEGYDEEILQALDFEHYRPEIVIVETIEYRPWVVLERSGKEIRRIMEQNGYVEYAFTGVNSLFVDPGLVR